MYLCCAVYLTVVQEMLVCLDYLMYKHLALSICLNEHITLYSRNYVVIRHYAEYSSDLVCSDVPSEGMIVFQFCFIHFLLLHIPIDDSVRREVLYSILLEFGIPMKLHRLFRI
jgi:hypothetical protein